MAAADVGCGRFLAATAIDDKRTARMKPAAADRSKRIGHLALDRREPVALAHHFSGANWGKLSGAARTEPVEDAPTLLTETLQMKQHPNVLFAGQISGVEGYVESAAMGLLAGRFAAAE